MPQGLGLRVKIIGLLSWYDERPSWLAGVVTALAHHVQIAHLIAVDGAYGVYPQPKAYSGSEQHGAILETCRNHEIGVTIHAPQEPWFGNEVEKRNFCWHLAETIAEEHEDWYFICDADTFVTSALGLHQHLERAQEDVGQVAFAEPVDGSFDPGGCFLRCIFRAIPGLRFDTNHFTYRLPDGRNLHDPTEPAISLPMVTVEHRTQWRDPWRKEKQKLYYRRRDELGLELPQEVADVA